MYQSLKKVKGQIRVLQFFPLKLCDSNRGLTPVFSQEGSVLLVHLNSPSKHFSSVCQRGIKSLLNGGPTWLMMYVLTKVENF